MKNNKYKNIISNIYAVLVIIILWQALHMYLGENMVPSFIQTIEAFSKMNKYEFTMHLIYSMYRIISAVAISMAIGVPLGILIGMNKKIYNILSPIIYILYPIPKIAFLPIFMVLFGIGDKSKIILMTTIIVFQILIATRDAVLQIDNNILISAKIMKFNAVDLCIDIILPAICTNLFSAIRISIGIAISALFFSENYATKYGIGYFIMNSWSMVDYKEMFVGVLGLSIMSLFLYKIIDFLEYVVCPWNRD